MIIDWPRAKKNRFLVKTDDALSGEMAHSLNGIKASRRRREAFGLSIKYRDWVEFMPRRDQRMFLLSKTKVAVLAAVIGVSSGIAQAKTHISTVSPVIAEPSQTITITGIGFGSLKPYTGDSNYIVVDVCKGGGKCPGGGWEAGYAPNGNTVGLVVQSWTNTQITLAGFSGDYGVNDYYLSDGDEVTLGVSNPKAAKFPHQRCTVTVGSGSGANC